MTLSSYDTEVLTQSHTLVSYLFVCLFIYCVYTFYDNLIGQMPIYLFLFIFQSTETI